MNKIVIFVFLCTSSFAASHNPQQILDSVKDRKDEGAQIVQYFCATCHAIKPMIELGAPKVGVEKDWQPRLLQGLNLLFTHTEQGFGAMPARGGCFECSDKQLQLAILALLPKNKKMLNKTKR